MTRTAAFRTETGVTAPRTIVSDREALLARIDENERKSRRLAAERLRLYAGLLEISAIADDDEHGDGCAPLGDRGDLEFRSLRAEVATSLRVTEYQVGRDLDLAYALTTQYWRVWEALNDGDLSVRHARVIVDAGTVLGAGEATEVECARDAYVQEILPDARRLTPAQLRPVAQRAAERFAARTLDERHADARRRRRVSVRAADDGMADLHAHLPAVEAYAITSRLRDLATRIAVADDTRTRDEIHADVFSDLLLTGTPEQHDAALRESVHCSSPPSGGLGAVRARVQIMAGCEQIACAVRGRGEPPELVGYGPIPRATARALAGHTTAWEVISADPTNGAVLTVERYRPSEEMRRLLGARDEHCRFPGCRVPLARCDLDHTVDAARGGATSTDNLAHLCRAHHTLKHHSAWRVRQEPGGVLRWISPAGRTHVDRPPSRVRFTSQSPSASPDPPPW